MSSGVSATMLAPGAASSCFEVAGLVGHDVEAVRRHVVGEHAALAVEISPRAGHHRPRLDAVGFRARGVFGVLRAPAGGSTSSARPEQRQQRRRGTRSAARRRNCVGLGGGVLQRARRRGRHGSALAPRAQAQRVEQQEQRRPQQHARSAAPATTRRRQRGSPSARCSAAVTMRSLSSSAPIASACCDIGKKRSRARKRCRMKAITTRRSACSPSRPPKTQVGEQAERRTRSPGRRGRGLRSPSTRAPAPASTDAAAQRRRQRQQRRAAARRAG